MAEGIGQESRHEMARTSHARPSLQCRMNRRVAVILSGLFVCAAVAVGVMAYTLTPQTTLIEDQGAVLPPASRLVMAPPLPPSKTTLPPHPPSKPTLPPHPPSKTTLPPHPPSKTTLPPHPPLKTTLPPPPPSAAPSNNPFGAAASAGGTKTGIRLPVSLKPDHYTVQLQPFVDGNFTIMGYVEVDFDVLDSTSNITLNIQDIITHNDTVKVLSIDDLGGAGVGVSQHLYDHERQTYTAILKESLQKGTRYRLSMHFEGYLNNQLAGFYRSSYTDPEGKRRYIAVTQFEPEDARRAFPCFDEPAMKAKFDIRLGRQTDRTSISNMPLNRTEPIEGQDGWVWDIFDTSVPMSTYLVAFVVSDFVHRDSSANDHVLFRVWAREEAIGQTDYALQSGPTVLSFYETYFDVDFPLPKQDMIAIPDFAAGAMENWGLITYRETDLLFDPLVSAASNKERVAVVIAHELAHQWFGNLVTLKWWNDLWLNEGFATFVSYIGTSNLEPEWKMWQMFVPSELQSVMELDSLESSHPISVDVDNPDMIMQLFDGISYSKGASIIRMMMYFLKEENFKKGIHNYLMDRKFDNAEQDDLWSFLTEAVEGTGLLPSADTTVKVIMDTWTLQKGFPVITVTRAADGTSATVTQERFLLVKNETNKHEYRWWVPLTYTTQDASDFEATLPKKWMSSSEGEVSVSSLPASDKWVLFNVQESGFYKVNYDDNNWNLLIQQLIEDHQVIHVLNRAQLIDDALDLSRAGELSYNTSLSLNTYMSQESEYFPWVSSLANLGYLEKMFTRSAGYGDLKTFLLSLLKPLYDKVGFEDNTDDPQLLIYTRDLALSWTCALGYEDCVANSVALYNKWMQTENNSVIPPNLKGTVYCTGIAAGGENEWNFGWGKYQTSKVGSEKAEIMYALGCSKEIWILSRYLEMAFTEGSGIRKQDASSVFSAVARNDVGRDLAWNYLRDNWLFISNYFGSFTTLGDLVLIVAAEFNTREEKHELELFKAEHEDDLSTATLAFDQAIEKTGNNIAWMENNYDIIVQWLHDHLKPLQQHQA